MAMQTKQTIEKKNKYTVGMYLYSNIIIIISDERIETSQRLTRRARKLRRNTVNGCTGSGAGGRG